VFPIAGSKIKKRDEMTLALQKAPESLATSAPPRRAVLVAFAAETDDLESNAREKLVRKNADPHHANDVADARSDSTPIRTRSPSSPATARRRKSSARRRS